jgi:hypothetical protein
VPTLRYARRRPSAVVHPIPSCQVGRDRNPLVAELLQETPHPLARRRGRFENEPPARPKRRGGGARDGVGGPGSDQGDVRLPVAHLRLEGLELVGLDVGRVRDDELEPRLAETAGEIVLDQLHAAVDTR